jgi:hypothetical protein
MIGANISPFSDAVKSSRRIIVSSESRRYSLIVEKFTFYLISTSRAAYTPSPY